MFHRSTLAAAAATLLSVVATAQAPDLTSYITSYASTQRVGQVYYATVMVRNVGNATAGGSYGRLVMSRDSVISNADTYLSAWPVPSLSPGRYYYSRRGYRCPSMVGRCYLGSIADYSNRVRELRETNNTYARPVTCLAGGPDLVVDYVRSTSTRLVAGGLADVSVRVRNIGSATAGSSVVGIFLSGNTSITTGDASLGATTTGTLSPGQYVVRTLRVRVPYCTNGGTCYLGAISDVTRRVSESSESNNTRYQTSSCTAYAGTGRVLEYYPRYGLSSTTSASVRIGTSGVTLPMCITSPKTPGYFYVLAWSGSSSFRFDALTQLGLDLLNGPIMPSWFGRLDTRGRTTRPALRLPKMTGVSRFLAYTHLILITPALKNAGFGSTRLSTSIGS